MVAPIPGCTSMTLYVEKCEALKQFHLLMRSSLEQDTINNLTPLVLFMATSDDHLPCYNLINLREKEC